MEALLRLVTIDNKVRINNTSEIKEVYILNFGTGFFITNDGYFVTAGHVVYDNQNKLIAIYNDSIYEVEIIKNTYPGDNNYKVRFNDYALGKINLKINDPYIISNAFQIEKNIHLNITGYIKSQDISEYEFDFDYFSNEHYPLISLSGVCINTEYYMPKSECLTNAFVICYDNRPKKTPKGLSGSPIFNGKSEVIGVFVKGHEAIGIGIIMDEVINDLKNKKLDTT